MRSQTLLSLADVPAWLSRTTGRRIHRSAIYRWVQRGVLGIRLPAVRIGGTRYSSVEAIAWWSDAITHAQEHRDRRMLQPAIAPRPDDAALLTEAGIL